MSTDKPLLIYDGDCGFCRRWIKRWHRLTKDSVEYVPYQQAASNFPEILLKQFRTSVVFVDTDKKVYFSAEAVFRSLAVCPSKCGFLWAYQNIPGFRGFSEFIYQWIAAHR